ncbi:Exodeoxyribonuclease V gamma chain [Neisseria meningitidis serogroup B]|uniref:Exodeoxyribonuclease V gamma chain n=1 Tax=Neisseria meningitidis serogroup B TaxID=491 RepID=A0A0H5DLN8_NEIMI|nr:Exodeoxyribonuclease V gamma chain [Neisseria meningitidis serogroup B]
MTKCRLKGSDGILFEGGRGKGYIIPNTFPQLLSKSCFICINPTVLKRWRHCLPAFKKSNR